jgi:hypothetical protein
VALELAVKELLAEIAFNQLVHQNQTVAVVVVQQVQEAIRLLLALAVVAVMELHRLSLALQ